MSHVRQLKRMIAIHLDAHRSPSSVVVNNRVVSECEGYTTDGLRPSVSSLFKMSDCRIYAGLFAEFLFRIPVTKRLFIPNAHATWRIVRRRHIHRKAFALRAACGDKAP